MNGMVGVCISIIITNWRRGGDGGRKTEAARGELTVPSLNLLQDYIGNIPLSSCLRMENINAYRHPEDMKNDNCEKKKLLEKTSKNGI